MAFIYAGNDLLSHTLSRAVPSVLWDLTSVFGMGKSMSPACARIGAQKPRAAPREAVASDVVVRFARGYRNLDCQAAADILSLSRAFGTFVILPSRIR